ncbi:MAG: ATP-binding protein [Alphaproteobacteria bacterium]|nr:ATP-binding protein [Alphaproteobacteria bacterium]
MIPRPHHLATVGTLLTEFPVTALVGARQVGKTTLARQLVDQHAGATHWFDLQRPPDLQRLDDPFLTLEPLRGLVVIDEIQRAPGLFSVLRALVDAGGDRCRFLVLGSASPGLVRGSSESLAGRIATHTVGGLGLDEVGAEHQDRLWLRGGFPRSFLAPSDAASMRWRKQYVRTFLERDVPQLGIGIPAVTLRRFWTMLCHHHGQVLNLSELGRAFGVAHSTVRSYIDILDATFVVRQLPAWFENLSKRQVKAPKVYLTDTGVLHALLNVETLDELLGHPKVGASWEGFAMDQVLRHCGAEPEEAYFWGTHAGAELDLLVVQGLERQGYEFKRTSTPKRTRSMLSAMESLALDRLRVIHPGRDRYPLGQGIEAVPLVSTVEDATPST